MPLLAGKSVLVTGGSRGIGAAIAREAAEEGAHVAFTFRSAEQAADDLARELEERYPLQRCIALQCDVTDRDGMLEVVEAVTADLGEINVLVNNAGVTDDAAFGRMTPEQWDRVIAVNLGGLYSATRPLVLDFVKRRSGSIVNITSVAGIYGSANQANYAASKAGIIGLTKALSKEIGPFGVRVNAVAPGFIQTDMIGVMNQDRVKHIESQVSLRRLGTSRDVAPMVCFLASDKASYVNGQVIQIDGGITL